MKTSHDRALSTLKLIAKAVVQTGGCALLLAAPRAIGQSDGFQIIQPSPGGIDPHPHITSITPTNNEFLIKWFGFQGPYQVQRKTNLNVTTWNNLGSLVSGNSATVAKSTGLNFHRISGAAVSYQGDAVCFECHVERHNDWSATAHARAFNTLKQIGQQNNPECVVCHTVGAGVAGGFVSEAATPDLINVQCENCHGPAGNHIGSGDPPTIFPIKTRSPMLCGGCHNGFHHPTYDEWTSSPHSVVIEDLVGDFSSTNRTTAIGRMNTCGGCHSGAVRLAMLDAYNSSTDYNVRTNVAWPSGFDATNTPISCIVCHESHRVHKYTNVITGVVYTNQLRYPLTSTNVYSYNTGTNFASQFNPNVNVCGQCHNARGASVASSSRSPHYSPQYNVFLGIIGVTASGPTPPQGAHRTNPRQCAGCHTHRHNEDSPDPNNPTFTGHAFRPSIEACMECHTQTTGPLSATNRLFTTQVEISGMIATTNSWASKYEELGWEYTTPGDVSNPSGSTTIVGPNATEQAQIPQGIKDARFNLYLIAHDKSLGIHNAPYTRYLLQVAQQKVNDELAR
jgi:hypothetical protein